MLTSDQSIVEFREGQAYVDRLTQPAHRHYLAYAEQMLAIYAGGAGRERRQLHRQLEALFSEEADCPVRRVQAFCKLLDDASVYETDPEGRAAKLRLDLFTKAASYHPLVQTIDQLFENQEQRTKDRLAADLNLTWPAIDPRLYADVISYQRLERFEGYADGTAFLSRYNVAQLQAALYRAERLTIHCLGDFKQILRYAKLARLLHDVVRLGPSHYRVTLSGPVSVLRETRRYGISLAKFLPALLCCRGWKMDALMRTPWNQRVRLHLSAGDGFRSHLPPPDEFDSRLEESLAKKFGSHQGDWQMIREGDILHQEQTTFVPDFTFVHADGTEIFFEIVGFWTPEYLDHKRKVLQRFRFHNIVIAVPEKSIREGAGPSDRVLTYKTTIKLKPLLALLERIRTG